MMRNMPVKHIVGIVMLVALLAFAVLSSGCATTQSSSTQPACQTVQSCEEQREERVIVCDLSGYRPFCYESF